MSKCSKCGKKLDHLNYDCLQSEYGIYDSKGDWDFNDLGDPVSFKFYCPFCDCLIADSLEKANKFLKIKEMYEDE
jgi:hypothetical protein